MAGFRLKVEIRWSDGASSKRLFYVGPDVASMHDLLQVLQKQLEAGSEGASAKLLLEGFEIDQSQPVVILRDGDCLTLQLAHPRGGREANSPSTSAASNFEQRDSCLPPLKDVGSRKRGRERNSLTSASDSTSSPSSCKPQPRVPKAAPGSLVKSEWPYSSDSHCCVPPPVGSSNRKGAGVEKCRGRESGLFDSWNEKFASSRSRRRHRHPSQTSSSCSSSSSKASSPSSNSSRYRRKSRHLSGTGVGNPRKRRSAPSGRPRKRKRLNAKPARRRSPSRSSTSSSSYSESDEETPDPSLPPRRRSFAPKSGARSQRTPPPTEAASRKQEAIETPGATPRKREDLESKVNGNRNDQMENGVGKSASKGGTGVTAKCEDKIDDRRNSSSSSSSSTSTSSSSSSSSSSTSSSSSDAASVDGAAGGSRFEEKKTGSGVVAKQQSPPKRSNSRSPNFDGARSPPAPRSSPQSSTPAPPAAANEGATTEVLLCGQKFRVGEWLTYQTAELVGGMPKVSSVKTGRIKAVGYDDETKDVMVSIEWNLLGRPNLQGDPTSVDTVPVVNVFQPKRIELTPQASNVSLTRERSTPAPPPQESRRNDDSEVRRISDHSMRDVPSTKRGDMGTVVTGSGVGTLYTQMRSLVHPTLQVEMSVPADLDEEGVGKFLEAKTKQARDAIRRQFDYYFSDVNLPKDTFLRSVMDDQRWVPLKVLAGFNRIKAQTSNLQFIIEAIGTDHRSVELAPCKTKVRQRRENCGREEEPGRPGSWGGKKNPKKNKKFKKKKWQRDNPQHSAAAAAPSDSSEPKEEEGGRGGDKEVDKDVVNKGESSMGWGNIRWNEESEDLS